MKLTNPAKFEISNDTLPEGRTVQGHKYEDLFASMKPGQCIKCPSEDVGRVGNGMRSFIKREGLENVSVRSAKAYPGDKSDQRGRVWLWPEPVKTPVKLRRAA